MREILFRGLSVNGKEWLYSMTVSAGHIKTKFHNRYFEIDNNWRGVIPETVGQYTGLTDKNGAKIFEGDIVMYKGNYDSYIVIYRDDLSRFCVRRKDGGASSDLSSFYEIIGNIHEGDK